MLEREVVVVGAGPAGMSAAQAASKAGAQVTLIDNYQPGGQYFRQLPPGFESNGRPDWGADEETGKELLRSSGSIDVELFTDAIAYSIVEDRTIAVARQDHHFQLQAKKLIIATGAYECAVPFHGWTLPGVFSAGAMQRIVKLQHVLPGKRILVVGSGPLLYLTASMLVDAGAQVRAVIDAARWGIGWLYLPHLIAKWRTLLQGMKYLWNLQSAGVPLLNGRTILRVEGKERAERAVVVKVDDDWFPLRSSEQQYEVDAVCVSFGLLPATELIRLTGCTFDYKPKLGGFIPIHNKEMETSIPGVFVAGEVAGIGGAGVAMIQGKIAGIVAARQLGCLDVGAANRQLQEMNKELARQARFQRAMNDIFYVRDGIWNLADDDTIICRCEEVTKAEISRAVEESAIDAREVRLRSWAGMGPCQGRLCGEAILHIFAATKGMTIDKIPLPRVRPPVQTVPVLALMEEREP